jgi:hypothetical protein
MRQAAITVTVCLCLLLAAPARGGDGASASAGTIARARRLIDAKDYASATALLEDLLLEASAGERTVIFAMLRQSYEVMAQQAKAAGRDREAAHYRDNLAILNANPRPSEPARPASTPVKPREKPREKPRSPAPADGVPTQQPEPRPAQAEPKIATPAPKQPASGRSLLEPAVQSEPPIVARPEATAVKSSSEAPAAANSSGPVPAAADGVPKTLSPTDGDRLFSAKRYDEAGQCYAALARENRLPANRANHWAYCRIVVVAARMNARPKSAREWDEIEAEIQSIQRLAPKLWYGDYLQSRLAEVRTIRSQTQPQSDKLVVRGSAPDESLEKTRRFPRLFGKSRAEAPAKSDPGAPAAAAAAADDADALGAQRPLNLVGNRSQESSSPGERGAADGGERAVAAAANAGGPSVGSNEAGPADPSPAAVWNGEWQVHETANFRIFHVDARLAESAAEAAESVRSAQAKRWGSSALQRPWAARCEIYLYPDGKTFAQATGQPESSPGFSTMESDGKAITFRKVQLHVDQPKLLAAILPHEVTHVVVADLFIVQQIPRWADEGIAVLAEPATEQNLRADDLRESLTSGQVFDLSQLMSTDTPEAKDWSLYYAQSVSITRFLVEQGTPEQFVQFVRESGRKGIETALREVYRIGGFAELQKRWQGYARQQLASTK